MLQSAEAVRHWLAYGEIKDLLPIKSVRKFQMFKNAAAKCLTGAVYCKNHSNSVRAALATDLFLGSVQDTGWNLKGLSQDFPYLGGSGPTGESQSHVRWVTTWALRWVTGQERLGITYPYQAHNMGQCGGQNWVGRMEE